MKGQSASPATQFKPGQQNWRPTKPYHDRDWLNHEYSLKRQSMANIASQFRVTEAAVRYWLVKHKIPTRCTSEVRALKRWGASGVKNPMYGKRGLLSSTWRGGHTPLRQALYASSEWKHVARLVRRRDKACRLCLSTEATEIHHIIPFCSEPNLAMVLSNLILLCRKCHRKMIRREHLWEKELFALIQVVSIESGVGISQSAT